MLKNELVEGLKSLGDNVYVVDSNFTADLTIMEEGTELLTRVKEALAPKKKRKKIKRRMNITDIITKLVHYQCSQVAVQVGFFIWKKIIQNYLNIFQLPNHHNKWLVL